MLPRITGVDEEDWNDDGELYSYIDKTYPKMETNRMGEFLDNELNLCAQLAERDTKTTPDFLDLKRESSIMVLVYGTLKSGGLYHEIVSGCPFLGIGKTADIKFDMMETTSFPVVFEIKHGADKGTKKRRGNIQGEVYAVDAKTMLRLDQLENNGKMYTRQKTWVRLIDQAKSGVVPTIPCWMYIGNEEFFDHRFVHQVIGKYDGRNIVYEWDVNSFENRMAM